MTKNIQLKKQTNLTSGTRDALNSLQLTLSNLPLLICFLSKICCTTETSTQVDKLHNELIKHIRFSVEIALAPLSSKNETASRMTLTLVF